MMKDVKVLLFDLGGVIIDIDPSNTINTLRSLSKDPSNNFSGLDYRYSKEKSPLLQIFFEYEKGNISDDIFRDGIRKIGNIDASNSKIDSIWNSVIVKIYRDLLDIIFSLRNRFKIMILSNTNYIHKKHFNQLVVEMYGKRFDELFDMVFYSYELGTRKPEKTIYQRVLDDCKFEGSDILFFDDMKENLEASEMVGMKTFHVRDLASIKKFLKTI
jgi:epoxide hydrolase-like predicted phosphatase|tara:strand:+ start:419 stop:1063 length:645 start_codon:yes stop_codon:yes gene_type:complete